MEQAPPGEVVQEQEGEEEEEEPEEPVEWVEPEPVPGLAVNAFVRLAEQRLPISLGSHVTSSNVPIAGPPW